VLAFKATNGYNGFMTMKHLKLSDEVRQAVDACGLSRYRIAKLLDVEQSLLSRFMAGKGGLSTSTLDALAELIDLHVVAGRRPKPKKE